MKTSSEASKSADWIQKESEERVDERIVEGVRRVVGFLEISWVSLLVCYFLKDRLESNGGKLEEER